MRYFVEEDQPSIAAMFKAGQDSYLDIPIVGQCYKWFVNEKLKPEEGDVSNISKSFMTDPRKGGFWVAELENEIVGFVGMIPSTRFDSSHTELVRMFVSPDVRKRAIGAKLIATVEAWARNEGYKHIYLSTLAGFPGANVLYLRNGFVLVEAETYDCTQNINSEVQTTVCINHYVKDLF